MSKQDRTYTRTAADLERKYDFGSIGKGGGGGDSQQFSKLEQALSQYKTSTDRKFGEIEKELKELDGGSSEDVDVDYSLIEFDTSEIVVTPSDKILSHVGMIIQSSTLDTMEKVIEVYGGTTWRKIEGRFLLGQSSSYAIGSEGGEATHKLTESEMPAHKHAQNAMVYGYYGWNEYTTTAYSVMTSYNGGDYFGSGSKQNAALVSANCSTNATGGGAAHNNMPPYKSVYIWERIA